MEIGNKQNRKAEREERDETEGGSSQARMPFVPSSTGEAAAMIAVTFVVWGHWPVFQRLSRSTAPVQTFFASLVLYQTLTTSVLCLTAGAVDGFFLSSFVLEAREHAGPVAIAVITTACGGASLALGEFLTAVAIEELGVAVGAPMIWSLALVGGMLGNYLIDGVKRPAPMLAGMGLALIAFLCDSQSHYDAEKLTPSAKSEEEPSVYARPTAFSGGKASQSTPRAQVVGIAESSTGSSVPEVAQTGTDPVNGEASDVEEALEKTCSNGDAPTFCPSMKSCTIHGGESTQLARAAFTCFPSRRYVRPRSSSRKLLLALSGGLGLAGWTALSTLSSRAFVLSPYALALSFQLGELLATLPILFIYGAVCRITPRTPAQVWHSLAGYGRRGHVCAFASGAAIAIGYWLYFITRGVIDRPIAYGAAQACGLVPLVYGAVVFGEYRHAPLRNKLLLGAALIFYPAAVATMALSI